MRMFGAGKDRMSADAADAILARASVEFVTKGEQALAKHLLELDVPTNSHEVEFYTELVIFSAFAFDILVFEEQRKHAEAIRAAFRRFLLGFVNALRADAHRPGLSGTAWEDRVSTRFSTYIAPLQAQQGGAGLMRMSNEAYRAITGSSAVDAAAAMHLGMNFSLAMKHMRPVVQRWDLGND